MTAPREQEDLDYLILGAMASPGMVTITGHDCPKKWKDQKAPGQSGAATILEGDDIREIVCVFTLVDDEDFERWDPFQRLIESTTPEGSKPTALPIYHPDLARQRITEVTNGGVGGRVYDGKGGASHTVKLRGFAPPRPKPPEKAGAGSRQGTTTLEAPDPNAAAKAELAALVEEARTP